MEPAPAEDPIHDPTSSKRDGAPTASADAGPPAAPPFDLVGAIHAADEKLALLPTSGTVVVAVSGGGDSVALLDAMQLLLRGEGGDVRGAAGGTAPSSLSLHVAHLDHGLRADSVEDAAFVARFAAERGLPATLEARDVRGLAAREGDGLEAAARRARYAFLARVADEVGATVVLTGHHRDDQAETLLMALLRGAGLDGLSGMSARSRWPISAADVAALEGTVDELPRLVRPLLEVSRPEIAVWCEARGLVYRQDPSNRDQARLRNRIRHEILPALETVNPRLRETLARTAAGLEEDRALIAAFVDEAWSEAVEIEGAGSRPRAAVLRGPLWRGIDTAVRRRLVRRAVAALGGDLRALGFDHVAAVCAADNAAASGARAPRAVGLPGGLRAVPSAEGLRIERATPSIPPPRLDATPVSLAVPGRTQLPGGWVLDVAMESGARRALRRDPWRAGLDADAVGLSVATSTGLTVRGRRPGDRFQPLGMAGRSKSLQDFFVDARVPAAERDGWPLVVVGTGSTERIVWIPGHRVDERVKVHAGTKRTLQLRATPPARLT